MRRTTLAAVALAVLLPLAAYAQEEEEQLARGLFISQWRCPPSDMSTIAQYYDSLMVPIEQELVNEGLLYGSGMFFHQWGDEWNVNWYRTGIDRDAIFDAIEEVGRRFEERHGDVDNPLAACSAHKDNIYWWGPRTTPPPPPPQ
jgi:hypothetical protein